MTVALALLGLAFRIQWGGDRGRVGAVPGFAVRPSLLANSAPNMIVAPVFPTICAAAFIYVSWCFRQAGPSSPRRQRARAGCRPVAHFDERLTGALALNAGIMGRLRRTRAPVALAAVIWVYGAGR
jgi:hypothetical protein